MRWTVSQNFCHLHSFLSVFVLECCLPALPHAHKSFVLTCLMFRSSRTGCGPIPSPSNGTSSCSSSDMRYGACTFACAENFTLIGDSALVCNNTGNNSYSWVNPTNTRCVKGELRFLSFTIVIVSISASAFISASIFALVCLCCGCGCGNLVLGCLILFCV